MQLPFIVVLIVAALLIGLLFAISMIWFKLNQRLLQLEARLTEKDNTLAGLYKEIEQLQFSVLTINKQQVTNESRVESIKSHVAEELNKVNKALADAAATEPADKLYSRALKLVSKGADVQELMEECELPLAEAEMLIAIHRQHK